MRKKHSHTYILRCGNYLENISANGILQRYRLPSTEAVVAHRRHPLCSLRFPSLVLLFSSSCPHKRPLQTICLSLQGAPTDLAVIHCPGPLTGQAAASFHAAIAPYISTASGHQSFLRRPESLHGPRRRSCMQCYP